MKKKTQTSRLGLQRYGWLFLLLVMLSCNKQQLADTSNENPANNILVLQARSVGITNPGFESDKTGWGDPNLFAISTSDHHSGTKSAKVSSAGDMVQQTIAIGAGTDSIVTVKAWILDKGTLTAKNGSTVLATASGNYATWTQVTLTFSATSLSSFTIYGLYNGGVGRFDDFTVNEDPTAPPATPTAPSNLAATASGLNINLTWTDNSNNETGFKLERKTGAGGTYAEIASSIAANTTSYADNSLSAGTTYYYRLRAYNAGGNSSYTTETSATTLAPPTAPSALAATASGTSTINLSWTDNSTNETGFKIERKTGAGGTYAEIVSNQAANSTSYSNNTGLSGGTTYYYRIRAYNVAGNSSYSTETSATTATPTYPAGILDLTNWKITIPIDANGNQTGNAIEVTQPALATYSISPYFLNNATNDGVIFQSNTGGSTTSGSGYPRSELREMTNSGASLAAWSASSGTHTMIIDEAITHLPVVKPHIVAGQIHGDGSNSGPDGNDDVIVLRLEGSHLFMDHNGTTGTTITNSYVLGTRFTIKIEASGGQFKTYYNGTLIETYTRSMTSGYFKAGAYVQSSCKSGQTPGTSESCSAYGEVVIYSVTITHQ